MSALICGSLAYDTIMVFPDQFKNHILPDKVHILNVSFLVPRMRREFGGCAGNIAYNLKLLGGEPIPMATVGQDFGPYREWFVEQGIDMSQVKRHRRAVHPAGVHHHRPGQQPDHRLPPGRDDAFVREPRAGRGRRHLRHRQPRRPRRHAAERHRIRRGRHPLHLRSRARRCRCSTARSSATSSSRPTTSTVNDYESNLLQERTGWERERDHAAKVRAYITTRGPRGSQIHAGGEKTYDIPPARERRDRRPDRLRRRVPRRPDLRPDARPRLPTCGRMGIR